jgi:hypothetical protein
MSMEGPLGALSTGLTVSTTEVEDIVNGGPPGRRCRWVWQRPPPSLKTSLMAVPLGALPVGPAASTAEFEDDVDGGPLRGHYWRVRQCPPPRLKMTSMVGPLGALSAGPTTSTTEFKDDGSRSHPVSKHPVKQSVENSNYPCGPCTPGC